MRFPVLRSVCLLMTLAVGCTTSVESVTKGEAQAPDARGVIVRCGTHEVSASALSGPTGAERGDDAPARALREFLADQEGYEPVHRSGYRVVYRDEDEVEYATGDAYDRIVIHVVRERGEWRIGASDDCAPEVVRDGFEVVQWEPVEPPDGRKLHLTYSTTNCQLRDPPPDRFERAEVAESEEAVVVTVLLRPDEYLVGEEGETRCLLRGFSFDRVIELPSALGDRRLLDGSTYPPHEPGEDLVE